MKSGDILAERYRLERKIGEGAMGEVWAAENTATHGKIAIKLIVPQAQELRTADLRMRLLREAKNCGQLRHRNIVQIHDVGSTKEGDPFLVMELLRGQTLADLLKEKRRLEPALAARIGAEIASALAVAHAAKVVHRDLKPANIFLHHEDGMPDGTSVAKILDFGVAKDIGGNDVAATQTGVAVGSVAYMSPEQVAVRKDLDGRSDIWALGVVLFEMLTGGRPFTGSVMDVSRQILLTSVNPVPPPSERVRGIPPEFDAIVKRCLDPTKANRFQDAAELSRALWALAETSRSAPIPMSMASPPMSSSGRYPAYTPEPAAPASVPQSTTPFPRAPMASAPEAAPLPLDGTLPMTPEMMAAARAARVGPPSKAQQEQQVTGTQILDPSMPLASPAPAWRKEYEEERARRQSSAYLEAVQLPPPDPTGTTSAAGALTQPSAPRIVVPQALRQEAAVVEAKPQQKRVSGLVLGLVALVGLSAAATAVAVVVMKGRQGGGEEVQQGTTTQAAVPQPSQTTSAAAVPATAATAAPAPTNPADGLPRPPVTAEPSAEPAAPPPEPTAPTTGATVAPPPPPPPPVKTPTTPTAPPVKKAPAPACTKKKIGLFDPCKSGIERTTPF